MVFAFSLSEWVKKNGFVEMFTVLDRYLLRSLLTNYVIGIGVMLSLYVVLDLFVNMDEFTERGESVFAVTRNVVDYYLPNLALYFAQLGGIITLFACGAVLARMRKLNEVTAMLASGVSLYRVARPILLFAIAASGLLVIDTEVIIPSVAHKLARKHDEVGGQRAYEVLFLKDGEGALLSAGRFFPESGDLQSLLVMERDEGGAVQRIIESDRATWEPPINPLSTGTWRLDRGRSLTRVSEAGFGPRENKVEEYPTTYKSNLSPKEIELRQAEGWVRFLSLSQLKELQSEPEADAATIMRTRHARVVSLIVSLLLVMLGLPFFLDRSPANILGDATKCVLVCGLCYVGTFVAQSIRIESLSAITAWIPVFVFGTLAMALLDRVRT